MPNAKELKTEMEFLRLFLCGESGTGKSVFASTCPEKMFLLNFDNSAISYRGKDCDYENYEASPAGWLKYEKDHINLKKKFKEDPTCYQTVILDSTTSMTEVAMERALQLDPKRSKTNGPLWNVHYGMVKNLISGKIRQLLELPCNIVVIGHLIRIIDNDSGAVVGVEPMLNGDLSMRLPSWFDEVYYSDTVPIPLKDQAAKGGRKVDFILRTMVKGHYKARSRISGVTQILPAEMPNDFNFIKKTIETARAKEVVNAKA